MLMRTALQPVPVSGPMRAELPILLLPLTLPAVLAAAYATALLISLNDPTWQDVGFAVSLVTLYDVLMLLAGFFTLQYVIEE